MKHIFILLTCIFSNIILQAQDIKVFYEKKDQGFVMYASNPEWYPVSVLLELKPLNMDFSGGEKRLFVVPSKTEKYTLGEMTVAIPGAKYSFNYTYKFTMGDVTIPDLDVAVQYDLPFQKNKGYKVHQGYNGAFSHQKENALDFTMPEGTDILASREGTVVQVVQNNTEACPREDCKKYNNFITIMHDDGSFANYAHLKYNGAKFKLGDRVKRGDIIALSGNTGYTSGPHLHFVSFLGGFDKWRTVATKFRINNGENSVLLSEGETYQRAY